MIRVAWIAALVLLTLTVLVLLWQFSAAVVLFLLSLAAAAAFRPILETVAQSIPYRGLALVVTFGLIVIVLLGFFIVITGPLLVELQQVVDDLFISYEWIKNTWQNAQSPLMVDLGAQLPPTQVLYDALIGDDSSQAIRTAFGLAEGTFNFLGGLGIILTLSLFWSADRVHFERLWLSLLPVESRAQARKIWQAVETGIGKYLRREFTLSVLSALCLWVGYVALGVHYPVLLALVGAFARLIPWFGPILVAVFPFLAGSSLGWTAGLLAAAYTTAILLLLEWLVGMRLLYHQRYSSLLLVIVMFALTDSFGLMGAVLAPLLSVAIQILFRNVFPVHLLGPEQNSVPSKANLYQKMDWIKQMTTLGDNPHASEIANLSQRLQDLLDKYDSLEQGD